MNTVSLIGRWVRDHEMRHSPQGKAVLNNTLAVPRRFDKDNSDFIRIVAFGKSAELAAEYTGKGSRVGIVGRIQTGSYQKDDGTKVYTTDVIADQVIFLDSRQKSSQRPQQRYTHDPGSPFKDGDPLNPNTPDDDRDLPF